MSTDARVSIALTARRPAHRCELVVPAGTPAGAIWGHLPREVVEGGPPEGVRYLLNGLRTIPGAPLRDGDRLEVAPPTDRGSEHA